MPSFASGLAAGLSPGIRFYGERLAQDRAEKLRLLEQNRVEKLFDARLAEQRKYTVMQDLTSEAGNWGVSANVIADMQRNGDPNAFRSILEKGKAHFAAGFSPEPTVPTEEQSGSPSYLSGQRKRNEIAAQKSSAAATALAVDIAEEQRRASQAKINAEITFAHNLELQKLQAKDSRENLIEAAKRKSEKDHSDRIANLQGNLSGIRNVPDKLRLDLFSGDLAVRDNAFWEISKNVVQIPGEDRNGNPTIVFRYVSIPAPSPLAAKPKPEEIMSELTIWRKHPVEGYPKEEEKLLNSNDSKEWWPALQRLKNGHTVIAPTKKNQLPIYRWTPKPPPKPSLQIPASTNSLPSPPGGLGYDTDPRQ